MYIIYDAADIEVEKCRSNTSHVPHALSPGQPYVEISQPVIEFGKTMCDLTQILEASDRALTNMLVAFEQMAYYMKSEAYMAIVNSNQYKAVDSVRTFFRLLAPHWKPVDCSLLNALVDAASCEKATKRLNEYLSKSHNVVLGSDDEEVSYNNEPETSAHHMVSQGSKKDVKASLRDAVPALPAVASTLTMVSEPAADSTFITCSQPHANSSAVPVLATVAADELNWGSLRAMKSLLCGIFRVPPFALQYDKSGKGSVVIHLVTSKKIASHIKSIMLDDRDMNLLLQEMKFKSAQTTQLSLGI